MGILALPSRFGSLLEALKKKLYNYSVLDEMNPGILS